MRISISVGSAYYDGEHWNDLVDYVVAADRLGVDSVWSAEAWGMDAVAPLAYLAAKTETISLGSGISYNLSNQDIITRFNGETSTREVNTIESEDFRKINYCFQTSMGWEHKLSENMRFSIAPTFRLWLAGIYRDALLNRNLYQFGLRATVRFDREVEGY